MVQREQHEPRYLYEPDMLDAVECSCGWHSPWFYDGQTFAHHAWKRHAEAASQSTNGERG